ncbi:MAG TPA: 6-bladed beta-propeller [archaeon]|nr:6-bladed beta-propeller [archaeon]
MRGITPVISLILLLLITISIVAAAFMFFQGITETAGTQAQESTYAQISRILQTVDIVNVNDGKVYVKNIGTQAIKPEDITILVDGVPMPLDNPGQIEPGRVKIFTLQLSDAEKGSYGGQRIVHVNAPGNTASKSAVLYGSVVSTTTIPSGSTTTTIPSATTTTTSSTTTTVPPDSTTTTTTSSTTTTSTTTTTTVPVSPPSFVLAWGTLGTENGQFYYPMGIAVDSSGNVYVTDILDNDRVQKFDSTGGFLTKWGSSGSGNEQFNTPSGVGVDSSGNVYTIDTTNERVQKFASTDGGVTYTFVTKWGGHGSVDGQFNAPSDIAVDSSGNVYVADTGNNRIQKFDSSGHYMTQWGSPGSGDGEFVVPNKIAVDSSGNVVYVADIFSDRIQKFASTDGGVTYTFVTKWELSHANGIAVDLDGNVYVSNSRESNIQKFDSTGNFITEWGGLGSGDGQFDLPVGVVVDSATNIYVVDKNNYRIQKFR